MRTLIEDFDNLYADLSSRNPRYTRGWPVDLQSLSEGAAGTGNLKSDWRNLFEDHPDRFFFGLDLSNSERWAQLPLVVSYYRGVLGELSQSTAEKVACQNARALLAAAPVPGPSAPWAGILALILLFVGAPFLQLAPQPAHPMGLEAGALRVRPPRSGSDP